MCKNAFMTGKTTVKQLIYRNVKRGSNLRDEIKRGLAFAALIAPIADKGYPKRFSDGLLREPGAFPGRPDVPAESFIYARHTHFPFEWMIYINWIHYSISYLYGQEITGRGSSMNWEKQDRRGQAAAVFGTSDGEKQKAEEKKNTALSFWMSAAEMRLRW